MRTSRQARRARPGWLLVRCIARYGAWYCALYSVLVRAGPVVWGQGAENWAGRAVLAGFARSEAVPGGAADRQPGLESKGATSCGKRGGPLSHKVPPLGGQWSRPFGVKGAKPFPKRSHLCCDKGSYLFPKGATPFVARGHTFFPKEATPLRSGRYAFLPKASLGAGCEAKAVRLPTGRIGLEPNAGETTFWQPRRTASLNGGDLPRRKSGGGELSTKERPSFLHSVTAAKEEDDECLGCLAGLPEMKIELSRSGLRPDGTCATWSDA